MKSKNEIIEYKRQIEKDVDDITSDITTIISEELMNKTTLQESYINYLQCLRYRKAIELDILNWVLDK